jgi:capsule polysaccharide export protein KpsE/RkpR
MEKQSSGPADIQVSASSVPSGNVPEAGLQYVRKLREVKYAEAMFELLAKQYEAARLDEAKTAAVIQVLDPAIEPDRKSSPERTWMVVIATLLGLFGSVGYVLSSEALGRMRLNPDVNERLTMLKTAVLQPHFQPRT